MKINVSLTSIYANEKILEGCIKSLLNQTIKADAIFLYLSSNEYLLDKGYPIVPGWLQNLPVNIIYTENTGPFRKLLPLLKDKWSSDEIIITVDDDTIYAPTLIETMINDYKNTGACISCRGFFLDSDDLSVYKLSRARFMDIHNFHTGKGAVLYHPSMFQRKIHPKYTHGIFSTDYLRLCKTADDMWFNLWRIYNEVPCVVIPNYKYMINDLTNKNYALYHVYNESKNNEQFIMTAKFIFG